MESNKELNKYILNHIDKEDALLTELDRVTNLSVIQPRMISGHLQGSFLRLLTQIISPYRVLELGTFTGYSTISLARGLNDGALLHTIEINDELEAVATRFIERAGLRDKVVQHIGDALNIVPSLDEIYDLIFIDADKRQYPDYYRMLLSAKFVREGTIIIADNVLWYGKVTEQPAHNDSYTKGVMEFNRLIAEDSRLEKVILPIRDGLTIARVKSI